jgi:hypothetical protein
VGPKFKIKILQILPDKAKYKMSKKSKLQILQE